jgi:GTP-binding protein Era
VNSSPASDANFRSGYVTIIGRPNAGKSTLLNSLLNFKLSIVSPKPQTTRRRVLGIWNGPSAQIVFLDTPGLIDPRYRLQERMMNYAADAVATADALLPIVDATEFAAHDGVEALRPYLEKTSRPCLLLLNKIDKVAKDHLLPMIDHYHRLDWFKEIIPVSALTGDGLDRVKHSLIESLPVHTPYYDPEILTEQPERFFVTEIIREKIFEQFSEEIPYSTDVTVDEFKEKKGRKDFIKVSIIVERASQKAILIGKQGSALKTLGAEARKDIEQFLGRPVFLELWVKVQEKWRDDETKLRRLGYA